jgi:hypothetical protein
MRTVDITPTWEAVLPAMLAVITNEHASMASRRLVAEELLRMARLADLHKEPMKISFLDPV